MTNINKIMGFLSKSVSSFHAIDVVKENLLNNGFIQLNEQDNWNIQKGKSYFITKNNSSIFGFKIPQDNINGFNIISSHSDSPCFKIKTNPFIENAGYVTLNTEKYGGMIMSTWMDRPLSCAGRVIIKEDNKFISKNIDIKKDIMIIPSLAIHMDRNINEGKKYNAQIDTIPILGSMPTKEEFLSLVAKEAGTTPENILESDLYLYVTEKAKIIGVKDEYIRSAKLDDLLMVYTSMLALIESTPTENISVMAVFDNEEVGSCSKQGAQSVFFGQVLERVILSLGGSDEDYIKALPNSFMISADNAHAYHPNYASTCDPTNKPIVNGGVVIKYNANQRYTTDAVSGAIFKDIVAQTGHKYQSFVNRSDIVGGSTLGSIASANVPINSVDIGLAQFAMHSSYETAGVKDTNEFLEIAKTFYTKTFTKQGENNYLVK